MTDSIERKSFLQDLWDRRFFQFVGSYLAVSFGILQFGQFVEKRYNLDFMLVEKMLIFLLILLPVFVIFIYNHGRPGEEKWLPYEKFMVPGSIFVGLLASIFLFNTSISAATETIIIKDDSGLETTRLVPVMGSNKRLVIFPFDITSGDEADLWKSVGGAYLLDKDLEQDMRLFSTQPLSLKYLYESYNQAFLADIPFSTQLKIARDLYSDLFLVTQLDADGKWQSKVYQSENGELVYNLQGASDDFFNLLDQISTQLSESLYSKESGRSIGKVDLPVSNLVSENIETIRLFIEGYIERVNDVSKAGNAITSVEEAVRLDPNCAECFSFLSRLYRESGAIDKAKEAINKAVTLSGTLPERQQFMITASKYNINDENDKVITLLENWRKLYPSDYNPYEKLISFYTISYQFDKAKEIGNTALENGHRGSLLTTLADLYTKTEEYDKAEKYLEEFAELYPHKSKERALLGDIYIAQGELEKAKKLYEDIGVFNPNDVQNIKKIANIEERQGNFEEAMELYKEALSVSNQVQDSMSIYEAIESYYERLGQFSKSREIADKREKLFQQLAPPIAVRQNMFFTSDIKMLFYGKEAIFLERKAELIKQVPQSSFIIDCIGGFLYNMFLERKEELKNMDDQCTNILLQSAGESWKHLIDGAIARLDGNYAEAVTNYESYIEATGAAAKAFSYQLSEVYRKGGQIKKADELMDKLLLEDPFQAVFLAEKAKIALARDNVKEAKSYYDKAMQIWSQADEEYFLYKQARELAPVFSKTES